MGSRGPPHLCQGLRRGKVKAVRGMGHDYSLEASAIQAAGYPERPTNFLVADAVGARMVFPLSTAGDLYNIQPTPSPEVRLRFNSSEVHDMRNESIGDEKVPQSAHLASQARLYQELAKDSKFPTGYMKKNATGATLALLESGQALHAQLIVNAQLLRTLIEVTIESGTRSYSVSIPPDGTLVTESDGTVVTESSVFYSRPEDEA